MNSTVFRSVFVAAALALALTAYAQEAARMDQTVQQLVDARQFMGSVLVARGDQVVFNKAYGDYALGLIVTTGKRKVYSHSGGIEGFNTHLAYYPETQLTVVALANLNGSSPADLAGKLGALAHGESITPSESTP